MPSNRDADRLAAVRRWWVEVQDNQGLSEVAQQELARMKGKAVLAWKLHFEDGQSIKQVADSLRLTESRVTHQIETLYPRLRRSVGVIVGIEEWSQSGSYSTQRAERQVLGANRQTGAVEITVEVSPDATEAEIKAAISALAKTASALHRAAGGSGLEIREARVEKGARDRVGAP